MKSCSLYKQIKLYFWIKIQFYLWFKIVAGLADLEYTNDCLHWEYDLIWLCLSHFLHDIDDIGTDACRQLVRTLQVFENFLLMWSVLTEVCGIFLNAQVLQLLLEALTTKDA